MGTVGWRVIVGRWWAKPDGTPIVTPLVHAMGVLCFRGALTAVLLCGLHLRSHITPCVIGPGGGWQGRSPAAEEEGLCPWMSERV